MKTGRALIAFIMLVTVDLNAADPMDLNGDGKIDTQDASVLLAPGGNAYDPAMDCNEDGKLDLADALFFVQCSTGMWEERGAGFSSLVYDTPKDRVLFSGCQKIKASCTAMAFTRSGEGVPQSFATRRSE